MSIYTKYRSHIISTYNPISCPKRTMWNVLHGELAIASKIQTDNGPVLNERQIKWMFYNSKWMEMVEFKRLN